MKIHNLQHFKYQKKRFVFETFLNFKRLEELAVFLEEAQNYYDKISMNAKFMSV